MPLGRSSVEINQGNLRSVNVAQAGERTRLVLNLKQASNYRAQLQGKALLLVLEPPARRRRHGHAEPAPVSHRPEHRGAGPARHRLPPRQRRCRPRRRRPAQHPGGRGHPPAGPEPGGRVPALHAARQLRRRLDVTDFGTPVQTVSTFQSGDRVRMVVEPRGNWEHSAYQTDNQFVLEVRPVKVDPNKLTRAPGFQGEKLSLNFQNIEVRALLQVIADFTNFNVVTSDTVTGNVTLRLKDVPWDQALDIILQSKGLGVRKNGNVLWIAPKDELAAKEQVELEAKKKIAELEPLRTQSFQLNYTKAEDMAKGLTGQNQRRWRRGAATRRPRASCRRAAA
jgi:type IV pilus assembly protein PilQ